MSSSIIRALAWGHLHVDPAVVYARGQQTLASPCQVSDPTSASLRHVRHSFVGTVLKHAAVRAARWGSDDLAFIFGTCGSGQCTWPFPAPPEPYFPPSQPLQAIKPATASIEHSIGILALGLHASGHGDLAFTETVSHSHGAACFILGTVGLVARFVLLSACLVIDAARWMMVKAIEHSVGRLLPLKTPPKLVPIPPTTQAIQKGLDEAWNVATRRAEPLSKECVAAVFGWERYLRSESDPSKSRQREVKPIVAYGLAHASWSARIGSDADGEGSTKKMDEPHEVLFPPLEPQSQATFTASQSAPNGLAPAAQVQTLPRSRHLTSSLVLERTDEPEPQARRSPRKRSTTAPSDEVLSPPAPMDASSWLKSMPKKSPGHLERQSREHNPFEEPRLLARQARLIADMQANNTTDEQNAKLRQRGSNIVHLRASSSNLRERSRTNSHQANSGGPSSQGRKSSRLNKTESKRHSQSGKQPVRTAPSTPQRPKTPPPHLLKKMDAFLHSNHGKTLLREMLGRIAFGGLPTDLFIAKHLPVVAEWKSLTDVDGKKRWLGQIGLQDTQPYFAERFGHVVAADASLFHTARLTVLIERSMDAPELERPHIRGWFDTTGLFACSPSLPALLPQRVLSKTK